MQRQGTTLWQLLTRWLVLVGLLATLSGVVGMAYADQWESVAGWATFGAGFVVMVVCAVMNMGWLIAALVSKRALIALNVFVMSVLAGAIMVGANYLAERRLPLKLRRIDITSRGLNKLSSKTRNLLEGLDKKVQVCALLSRPDIAEKLQDFPFAAEVRDLLDEYAASSPNLSVRYIDMMQDPKAAWEFIIWIKLPTVLKEHGVDAAAFKKAFSKAKVDTLDGFNLLRTIKTWDDAEGKIQEIVNRRTGPTLEELLLGKKKDADAKQEQKKEADQLKKKLTNFLANVTAVLDKAKLDTDQKEKLLKAIQDVDIPEPEANSVIFVCGKKSKHVKPYDMVNTDYGNGMNTSREPTKTLKAEDAFTAAIMEVLDQKQKKVYFVEGFGEHRTSEWGNKGYSQIKSEIEKANMEVKTLDLAREGKVPDDCDVLVSAGPRVPYGMASIMAIRKYLARGGALLALGEPLEPNLERFERKPSGMAPLLKQYNIDMREDVSALDVTYVPVLTNKGIGRQAQLSYSVLTAKYPKHRIVEDMQGRITQFSGACFVDAAAKPANADFVATRIVQGSKDGWGETDLAALRKGRASKDPATDVMPPVPIGAAAQRKVEKEGEKSARIVAIGDSDFVTNAALKAARNNGDLLVNAVAWLAHKESRIGIGPSAGKVAKLVLSKEDRNGIFYAAVVGLPCAWVLFGLFVLLMRSLRNVGLTRSSLTRLGLPVGLLLVVVGAVAGKLGAAAALARGFEAAGAIVFVLALIAGRGFVKGLFSRRRMAGANTLVMVVLGFAIVAMVCFVSTRRYLRFDWTKGHSLALSDAAAQVVKGVKKWITIYAMYPEAVANQYPILSKINNDLEEFAYNSPYVNIKFVPHDPDKRKAFFQALKLEPDERTIVVFQRADADETKVRYLTFEDMIQQDMDQRMMMQMRMQGMPPPPPKYKGEQALTNALKFVAEDKDTTLYFTTGHGERNIEKRKGDGFGDAHDALRRGGYRVKTVNLLEAGEVPEDCDVLIVAAPTKPFEPEAIDILRRYCKNNGRLFVMLEPAIRGQAPSGLAGLLADYKINVDESVLVVDSAERARLTRDMRLVRVKQPSVKIRVTGSGYSFPEVTEKLRSMGLPTVFYVACKVAAVESPKPPPYGGPPPDDGSPYKASKLLEASPDGWGETNVSADGMAQKGDDDMNGPIPFAAVEEPKPKPRQPWMPPEATKEAAGPRIVCVGDADWLSSYFLKAGNNANEDLLMRCVSWLAKDEGEIKIYPVPLQPTRMPELKPNQKRWTFAVSMIGLPLFWIAIGLLVWGMRRLRG